MKKAVITVLGKDTVGIIAKISNECAKYNINIVDITQKVLTDLFSMIMLVDTTNSSIEFNAFVDIMNTVAKNEGLVIHTMHEDIFNVMHKI